MQEVGRHHQQVEAGVWLRDFVRGTHYLGAGYQARPGEDGVHLFFPDADGCVQSQIVLGAGQPAVILHAGFGGCSSCSSARRY